MRNANIGAECDLQAGTVGNPVHGADDGYRDFTPNIGRRLQSVGRRILLRREPGRAKVICRTLKQAHIDPTAEIVTRPRQHDGANRTIRCHLPACSCQPFEHVEIYGVGFVRPVERNGRDVIIDVNENRVTHQFSPRSPACICRCA